jgi:hypothetical protein
MHRLVHAVLVLSVLGATTAQAEDATTLVEHVSRFQWGVGLIAGFDRNASQSLVAAGPGVYLRGGLRLDEHRAVEVEASAGSIGFSGFGRAGIDFAYTPRNWVSFAAGPVVGWGYDAIGNTTPPGGFVGGVARVDFHLFASRGSDDLRRAITLGISGEAGAPISESAGARVGVARTTWGTFLMAGYSCF